MPEAAPQRSAVVFGARNVGRAIIETLVPAGWAVAGIARSESTLAGVREAGALALEGDVTDPENIHARLAEVAAAHGGVDLVVNAASPYGGDRRGPFGGGPVIDATPEAFDAWATTTARAAFSFLSAAGRYLVDTGRPGTLIQLTGGSARRALPGRGAWAAGAFGVRAVTQAAALELRSRGVHVALLIIDAGIEPLDGKGRPGVAREQLADPHEIAEAVRFLASQGPRGATHELQVTPLAETWVP